MSQMIVVHPPDSSGGRRVHVDSAILGLAYNLDHLKEFLRQAGLDWEDNQVATSPLIEWRGGGPGTWPVPDGPHHP